MDVDGRRFRQYFLSWIYFSFVFSCLFVLWSKYGRVVLDFLQEESDFVALGDRYQLARCQSPSDPSGKYSPNYQDDRTLGAEDSQSVAVGYRAKPEVPVGVVGVGRLGDSAVAAELYQMASVDAAVGCDFPRSRCHCRPRLCQPTGARGKRKNYISFESTKKASRFAVKTPQKTVQRLRNLDL